MADETQQEEHDPISDAINDAIEASDETQISEENEQATHQTQQTDSAQQRSDSQSTQANQTQQQQQQKGASAAQDLVDAWGNVVARSGAERRVYERNAVTRAVHLEGENRQLRQQLKSYEDGNAIGTQLGLNPSEVGVGAQLVADLKKDPVGTVRKLLTELQKNGHNIEEVAGSNTGAINAAVREALKPILDRINQGEQQQRQRSEAYQRAEQEYNSFIEIHPDAKVHEDDLAKLMTTRQQMGQPISLEGAYLTLKNFYLEKQLDWAKPLSSYVDANGQSAPANQQQRQGQPFPAGRGNSERSVTDKAPLARESDDWDDIIAEVMS